VIFVGIGDKYYCKRICYRRFFACCILNVGMFIYFYCNIWQFLLEFEMTIVVNESAKEDFSHDDFLMLEFLFIFVVIVGYFYWTQ
jgi:hypothetical protein